ncbi:MAG TPA: Hsp20/alpha crystallin family protein [Gemmatales bacterium]|nr:Hsp20/alpha crystallin family protein [Gemmatales bacterium]HMP58050.1 Hsp20/alpha crystallin family protein [Gemmatales bacterium]
MTEITKTEASPLANAEPTRGTENYFSPLVDVFETEHELIFFADMPGATPDDIQLRYDRGELVLHGKVKPRTLPGQPLLREFEVGDFYRTFAVNEEVDPSQIEAEYKLGVLKVRLPKREEVKPRRIAIKG